MKLLCIDIGNTNVNFAIVEKQSVFDPASFPTQRLKKDAHYIQEFEVLVDRHSISAVAYCSVVPALNPRLESLFPSKLTVFQLNEMSALGLPIAYPRPSEIGHDRIANAIAAQAFYQLPSIIIDLGTAITFDVLSEKGYEGGIIAPGFELMSRYLNKQTALLPKLDTSKLKLDPRDQEAFGRSTVEAMTLGITVGFSGMVDALLEHLLKCLAPSGARNPSLISTGGSIRQLNSKWAAQIQCVDYLTLIGLAEAYQRRLNKERCN